jgi:hypothetical protein
MTQIGDRAQAEALRIAYDRLVKSGWKFSMNEIGENAGYILTGLKYTLPPEADK